MKFQVNDGENYQNILEAQISAEELTFAMRQAGKRLAARLNIPGFRKGKAPQSIVENFVGVESVLNEAADELVPRAYAQGLEELNLNPVEQAKIEIVQLKANEPLIFKATFTAKPTVELGQYRGLPLNKQTCEISEAEIDADLETQRHRLSRLADAGEGATAALKDVLSIDFTGYYQGEPFEGGKAENYPLELGAQSFIPGFEEQLVGMKAGEEKEIAIVFPEDYPEKTLAGQPAVFQVKVQEVKRRVWPELDDDFAQEVSETAETIADLRQEVAERLQKAATEAAERQGRVDILAQATANAIIDVPPLMIEQRVDSMVLNTADRLQMQGMEMQKFLEYSGKTAQELRESYYEQAEKAVRGDLMLEAVAKAENISVSEEEAEQELQTMANYYNQPLGQIKEALRENNRLNVLIDEIRMNKAADLIYSSAEVTPIPYNEEVMP